MKNSVILLMACLMLAPQSYAGWWEDIFKPITQTTACQKNKYPSFDEIYKRKVEFVKNRNMQILHCVQGMPKFHLCESFIKLYSMDKRQLSSELIHNPQFFKDVVDIDLNYALVKQPRSKEEREYYIFQTLIQQRAQIALDYSHANIQTLFVGDSLMHIFENVGWNVFHNAVFLGIGGGRTDSLLFRIGQHVKATGAKNVVISISGNDLLQDCKDYDIRYNRLSIVNGLKQLGVQNIYWMALPPLSDPTKNAIIPQENDKIKSLNGVKFLDSYTPMVAEDGFIKPEYEGDGIHFNDSGYRDVWIPLLKEQGL